MSAKQFLLIIALLTLSGCIQGGLHNSTKVFTDPSDMRPSDWSDPAEMKRAWQAALVRIPKSSGGYVSTTIAELHEGGISPEGVWPTVIYMHGCTGIWSGTKTRINFLARNGYAVVAPASFARLKYPQSCRPDTLQGGLYRPTLKMRQDDAGYAIAKAKTLPWVDKSNVFLMGLSQGGITTATFSSSRREHSLRARIVEGWTCHGGLDRIRRDQRTGIRACTDLGWGQRSLVPGITGARARAVASSASRTGVALWSIRKDA